MVNPHLVAGICGGGAALLLGVTALAIHHRRRKLYRDLNNANPDIRVTALNKAASRNFSSCLNALVRRALVETDPDVKKKLVQTIMYANWQPGIDRRMDDLRQWAIRSGFDSRSPTQPGGSADIQRGSAETGTESDEHETTVNTGSRSPSTLDSAIQNEEPQADPVAKDVLRENGTSTHHRDIDFTTSPALRTADNVASAVGDERSPFSVTSSLEKVTSSLDKVEQAAVELLTAGYGKSRARSSSEQRRIDGTDNPIPAQSTEDADIQALLELCTQRAISAAVMEELVRRVHAEDGQLERVLHRLMERQRWDRVITSEGANDNP
jgi:hypothetical protein